MATDTIKFAINRAYQFCEDQQNALDEDRISEEEWFEIHCQFFTGKYLAADNPRSQSGHGGDEAAYRYTRGMLLEAIDRNGTLLDVGCANGHLIEKLHEWLSGSVLDVEVHGLDISQGLLELAKKRLPHWSDRFHLGNALHWIPTTKFDFVCIAELAYVPKKRDRALLYHLFEHFVAPGGRLILGPSGEKRNNRETEEKVRAWGYAPTGYCEKSHQSEPALCRRMFWFDKEKEAQ